MVQTCCIVGCNVRSHDRKGKKLENGLSFHSFPAWKQHQGDKLSELTKKRRIAWVSAVRRSNITFSNMSKYLKVCSRHFHSGKPSYEMDEQDPDWVPTLNLGHCEVKATTSDRHARQLKRRYKKTRMDRRVREQVTETPEEVNNENTVEEAVEEERVQEGEEETPGEELSKVANSEDEHEPVAKRQQIECHLCEQRKEEINRLLQENRELRSRAE